MRTRRPRNTWSLRFDPRDALERLIALVLGFGGTGIRRVHLVAQALDLQAHVVGVLEPGGALGALLFWYWAL